MPRDVRRSRALIARGIVGLVFWDLAWAKDLEGVPPRKSLTLCEMIRACLSMSVKILNG